LAKAAPDKKSLHYIVKSSGLFALAAPHLHVVFCQGQTHRALGSNYSEMRGRLPLRQKR
jgi:hypothetical protein